MVGAPQQVPLRRQAQGKEWKQCQTLFFGAHKLLQMVIAAMKLKDAYSLEGKVMTNLDSIFKSRDITLSTKAFAAKVFSQGYGFSSSHVWM